MQEAQRAARGLAQTAPNAIPNGLQAGGLVVMPGALPSATNGSTGLWQGANLPTETASGGRTQVTVKQTESKAILNWKEFNVGRETDLYFDQRAGGADAKNWIALNRVDAGTAPSRVLGSIKAEGQVYVINRNGIIFGGASQVNVQTLVASSLSLSNEQFMAGINTDLYVFNDGSGNSISKPQFGYLGQQRPVYDRRIDDPNQVAGALIGDAPGAVQVEAGAQITVTSGGKAMLFAPHVINSGQILAPEGQVIMAAGEQIYLRTSSAWADPITGKSTFRGLDIAASAPMRWMFSYSQAALEADRFSLDVQKIILPEMEQRAALVGYRVVNNGVVQADHGNITLTARHVMQNGALLASTALNNREGSIRLQGHSQGMGCYSSSYCDPSAGLLWFWKTGTVTLAPGSVTAAMPDLSDTSEIELTSVSTRYSPGRVELRGNLINIEREANVIVPAGSISIVAGSDGWVTDKPASTEQKRDGSRIYIGEGAYLSVAGLQDMLVAMERNVVTAELRINELRDSPLFKDSWLRGKVTLRAPLIVQPGADTVNVAFAGNIAGAREIVLEGFKQFDLASLANNLAFVGVKINGSGQVELDLAATAAGKLNALADYGAGTLVEFVRDFDISAAYGNLGGLASQSNFHARPGMELNYAGDIVLKSNWNLAAGTVDQAAAMVAGVMAIDPTLGRAYVVAGQEGRLLRDYGWPQRPDTAR